MNSVPFDITTEPRLRRPARHAGTAARHSRLPEVPPVGFYRVFNRRLDRLVVPYAVNETSIAALRDRLVRDGCDRTAGYWLLMARLAEMTLLCARHSADCGEIGAAGDLLLNPRRIHVHVRGADQPQVKDRHRRLSDQFNPGGLSFPEFTAWFQRNVVAHIDEPALLPGFADRLEHSGWFSATFLRPFRSRMTKVADAMRFASVANPSTACISGRPAIDTTFFRILGREVEQICRNAAYQSRYLTDHLARDEAFRSMENPLVPIRSMATTSSRTAI